MSNFSSPVLRASRIAVGAKRRRADDDEDDVGALLLDTVDALFAAGALTCRDRQLEQFMMGVLRGWTFKVEPMESSTMESTSTSTPQSTAILNADCTRLVVDTPTVVATFVLAARGHAAGSRVSQPRPFSALDQVDDVYVLDAIHLGDATYNARAGTVDGIPVTARPPAGQEARDTRALLLAVQQSLGS